MKHSAIVRSAWTRRASRCVSLALALVLLAVAQTACVGIGGETIRLAHDPLEEHPDRRFDPFRIASPATDSRTDKTRIGRATITLFAITSGSVHAETDVATEIAEEVAAALSAAGYKGVVASAADDSAPAGPVMTINRTEL